MDAVILAGGRGTRLASVVADVPKPLAPVCGRPFLDYQFALLARSGLVDRVVLSLGHLADRVIEHYERAPPPLPVVFVVEPSPLGTGGALRYALGATSGERLLALNGDSIFRWDLAALEAVHRQQGASASLSLVTIDDVARYGSVSVSGARVTSFVEKGASTGPGLINGGVYLFERSALETIPADQPRSLELDVLPRLVAEGTAAAAVFDSAFVDIGLPSTYTAAARIVPRFFDETR